MLNRFIVEVLNRFLGVQNYKKKVDSRLIFRKLKKIVRKANYIPKKVVILQPKNLKR